MSVVAEGTEGADQVAQLRALGCDFGQGYFFSRPIAAESLRALMRAPGTWVAVDAANAELAQWRRDQLSEAVAAAPPTNLKRA
jgi:predicted signal transduction protein with EAL and GGDEF domain